jgi:hypothetical protein
MKKISRLVEHLIPYPQWFMVQNYTIIDFSDIVF